MGTDTTAPFPTGLTPEVLLRELGANWDQLSGRVGQPDAAAAVAAHIARSNDLLDRLEARQEQFLAWAEERGLGAEAVTPVLGPLCDLIRHAAKLIRECDEKGSGPLWNLLRAGAERGAQRGTRLIWAMVITWPELATAVPDDIAERVWTVRISPGAYLRAMANLFWSAIRHPLSETTIDLSTGRVLYRT